MWAVPRLKNPTKKNKKPKWSYIDCVLPIEFQATRPSNFTFLHKKKERHVIYRLPKNKIIKLGLCMIYKSIYIFLKGCKLFCMRSQRRQATGLKGDKHPRKPFWKVSSYRVSKANVGLVFSVRKCIVSRRVIKGLIRLTWIKTIDRYSQQNQRRLLDYWLTFETFQLCKTNVNTYCWNAPSAPEPC